MQGIVPRSVRALVYPTSAVKPRAVALPIKSDAPVDFNTAERSWIEDVDLSAWFPHGFHSERVTKLPPFSVAFRNHYVVCTSSIAEDLPVNQSLRGIGLDFHCGDVIVLRSGARNRYEVSGIHSAERTLIDLVVRCDLIFVVPGLWDSDVTFATTHMDWSQSLLSYHLSRPSIA